MIRALRWAAYAGLTGFALGFFGPLIIDPGANQGPLLGIFITGPGGTILGFLLGLLPVAERARRALFALLVLFGVGVLVYFGGPKPRYFGQALDGVVVSCEDPARLLPAAVANWETIASRSTGAPRAGWKEGAPAVLANDPGVVVTVRAERWAALSEGRRFWNRGKLRAHPWALQQTTKRGFARHWGRSCAGVPLNARALYFSRSPQRRSWPPELAPGFLSLDELEPLPDDYKPLL
jgi:hypothetical protein